MRLPTSYLATSDLRTGRPVRGRTLLERMGIPLLSPVRSSEALASFAKAQDAAVVVLGLWFWGVDTLPMRYLRALRTKLPLVKLVLMSDDVHHKRLRLAAEDEGRPVGKEVQTLGLGLGTASYTVQYKTCV